MRLAVLALYRLSALKRADGHGSCDLDVDKAKVLKSHRVAAPAGVVDATAVAATTRPHSARYSSSGDIHKLCAALTYSLS